MLLFSSINFDSVQAFCFLIFVSFPLPLLLCSLYCWCVLGFTRMCNIQATRLQFFGTTWLVRRPFCNKFREIFPSYWHHSWNELLEVIWEWNAFLLNLLCYASKNVLRSRRSVVRLCESPGAHDAAKLKVRDMIHMLAFHCPGNSMVNSYIRWYFQ